MTKAQERELSVWEHFIPTNCAWAAKTDADILKFFDWSERGLHKADALTHTYLPEGRTYFHALVWGKKRAMIHAHEIWEDGRLNIPWFELLEELPPVVADWLKKERNLTDSALFLNAFAFAVNNRVAKSV